MASVILILLTIMLSVNLANFITVTKAADKLIDMIASGGGKFPSTNEEIAPPDKPDDRPNNPNVRPNTPKNDAEAPFDTRFFTVTFTENGNVYASDIDKIAAINNEKAAEMATKALRKGNERGYSSVYRYLITKDMNGRDMVIFVDFSRQLTPTKNFLEISLIVAAVGVAIVFVFVLLVSKKLVKPIADSYERQKRFVTDAGHELKTPLTVISANNDLSEMETGKTESTEAIRKQVKKLTSMVNNLTMLAKLDENSASKFEKFNVSDLVCDAFDNFKASYENGGKILTVSAEDATINADKTLVEKLVGILAENANKYSLTFTDVKLVKSGANVILTVANDAVGIKEGSQNKCFERFYRSDEARAGGVEGSGIGLSVAKEIVAKHKGKITAEGKNGIFEIKVVL